MSEVAMSNKYQKFANLTPEYRSSIDLFAASLNSSTLAVP